MRLLKRWMLPCLVLAGACGWMAGCGGDDNATPPGSAGMAGQGGGGGRAGSAGMAGSRAGSAGTAGAGTAGSPTAGSSGAAGNAGSGGGAGTGGATTDAGPDVSDEKGPDVSQPDVSQDTPAPESSTDETSTPEGSLTETSTDDTSNAEASADDVVSSDGAEASLAKPKLCFERCNDVDNCATRPGAMKFSCNPTTGRCATCTDDLPCIAAASSWSKACSTDGDCKTDTITYGDYCVDVKGAGFCAYAWNTTVTDGCLNRTVKLSIKKHEGADGADTAADTVDVCTRDNRFCDLHRGTCLTKCTADTGCSVSTGGKHCNVATGRCECSSAADCGTTNAVCNTDIKQCECDGLSCLTDGGRALTCEN